MTELFSNPGAMTTEQWLAVCILGFILLAILVMIHRLLAIMKMSRQKTYQPNFRRLRRFHSHSNYTGNQESESGENQNAEADRTGTGTTPGNENPGN